MSYIVTYLHRGICGWSSEEIWWLMYSRSSNSCFFQCFIITLMREQKLFPARATIYGVSRLPHVLLVFSGSPSFLPPPKYVHVRWTGVSPLCQTAWAWVWAWAWAWVCEWPCDGRHLSGWSRLVPWAAGRAINMLENHCLTCFS